jgi:GT2 family glycosyltransferase
MIPVSVLVCTRNRPDSLVRTVRSLLEHPGSFELILMDQSDDSSTRDALAPFVADPRLRYHQTRVRGKGSSLNEGLRLAQAPVVACTDDDCVVPPGWPEDMARIVEAHPAAAIVFCNVRPEPHDHAAGYVPAYLRRRDRVLRSVIDARNGLGLGAGMALRRDAVLALGGFDEQFGPGSRFGSGDDWDVGVRALLSGWHVYDVANLSVLHHGFRSFAEGKSHAYRDWVAIGALCAKPIRTRSVSGTTFAAWLFTKHALWPPVRDVLRLKRPRGSARIVGFARGFIGGLKTRVDDKTLVFTRR